MAIGFVLAGARRHLSHPHTESASAGAEWRYPRSLATGAAPPRVQAYSPLPERGHPLKFSSRFAAVAGALAAGLVTAGTAAAVQAAPSTPAPTTAQARALAAKTASNLVNS